MKTASILIVSIFLFIITVLIILFLINCYKKRNQKQNKNIIDVENLRNVVVNGEDLTADEQKEEAIKIYQSSHPS